ncbi:unnamed protein product, partial [Sphacelaria rigidula]
QQITKSREAYESQQTAYLHRASPTAASSRRSCPQSAGPSRASSNDKEYTTGSVKYAARVPRSASPGGKVGAAVDGDAGDMGGIDKGMDRAMPRNGDQHRGPPFIPPPPFSRRVDGATGMTPTMTSGVRRVGGRPGRARTRVRPSSAGARVYGKPGTGRGVGGEPCDGDVGSGRRAQGNARPQVCECYSIPASHKRFHLTSHLGFSSSQHYSSTPAAYSRAAGTTSPSRRPNSAVYRRTEISLSPRRQTVGSTPTMTSGDTATTTGVVPPPRSQRESEKRRCVGDPTAATATATAAGGVAIVAAADEGTECRREYPGSAQYNKGRTVRVGTGQPRIRPRSAVARVETTVHHQAETSSPVSRTERATGVVSATFKAAEALLGAEKYRKPDGAAVGGGCSRGGGAIGTSFRRARPVPRPQSAATRRSPTMGNGGHRSQRENMERIMARIFQQRRTWVGEKKPPSSRNGTAKGALAGTPSSRSRPQSARLFSTAPLHTVPATVPTKTSSASRANAPQTAKPHIWRQAARPNAVNFANSAAVAAAAAAARLGRGKPPGTIDCDDHGGAGSYSRLFGLKHPGSSNHRRVGVDPLGEFKKEHYR